MAILTVYTKLLDKTLTGTRIIDMGSTRTCQLYVIPRDQLAQVSKEQALHQYCFYILLGQTAKGEPKAYIGQSNDFLHRVKDHQSKKDFWHTALVFVSKANEIYASEVFFLEYLGITKAMETATYSLDENKQIPQKPSIAPDKENDMELFFDEIEFLTRFYGCTIFEKPQQNEPSQDASHTFRLVMKKKGIDATMQFFPSSQRYVITTGSIITSSHEKSCPKSVAKLREEVLSSAKTALRKGNTYQLLQDIELPFNSPSAAASFCTATSMQGTTAWVDSEGQTFAAIFKAL